MLARLLQESGHRKRMEGCFVICVVQFLLSFCPSLRLSVRDQHLSPFRDSFQDGGGGISQPEVWATPPTQHRYTLAFPSRPPLFHTLTHFLFHSLSKRWPQGDEGRAYIILETEKEGRCNVSTHACTGEVRIMNFAVWCHSLGAAICLSNNGAFFGLSQVKWMNQRFKYYLKWLAIY